MQFSQMSVIAVFAMASSTAMATPQFTHELSKRTCWELSGEALKICQEACTLACEAATAGLAKEACGTACEASELKVREIEAAARAVPQIEAVEARETQTDNNSTTTTTDAGVQITNIEAVEFGHVDASVGRDACVVACEVTCNSTVLALIQSECLSKCKALCPSS